MAAPKSDSFAKPKSVSGGCLCGQVRYQVDFPDGHDFVRNSGSCSCTQCRKHTGGFFFAAHNVPADHLRWTSDMPPRTYRATPDVERCFCGACGGVLTWKKASLDDISFAIGTVDPEFLVAAEAKDGEDFGYALANLGGWHVYCGNRIKGVTDEMLGTRGGDKWAKNTTDGIKM
ncbi:glutathione-dependent formaldehyde-activating GFA [Xylariaceae sp. FL0804]|nr:glutathione-dependent formaldehyde-activating GFA [Xylariaceae sp. FL0804]